MTRDDFEKLASALTDSWKAAGIPGIPVNSAAGQTDPDAGNTGRNETGVAPRPHVPQTIGFVSQNAPSSDAGQRSARFDVEHLAASISAATAAIHTRQAESERPPKSGQSRDVQSGDSGGSVAGTVLKTAGMVTGVGPIVTGLIKLFGGGGDSKPAPEPLVPYQLPSAVSVDAGLAQDRGIVSLGYSQSGQVRANSPSAAGGSTPQIQIQVNAMDSRSFMDHSDEIAAAVRAAMLRSHSLNDVVAEI